MLEKIFDTKKRPANPIWATVAWCLDRSKTGGAGNSAFIKGLYRNYRLCCLEAKSYFSPQLECCCDALGGGTQMDPNFKDSARDSAIKRLVCYTVWHSSFNGFMAVQTQLGRFQNGTHLFFSSLSVRLRSGQKARAEMISFIGFSSTGTRRTHGHLEGSFVSTWEPSAPCSFAGPS